MVMGRNIWNYIYFYIRKIISCFYCWLSTLNTLFHTFNSEMMVKSWTLSSGLWKLLVLDAFSSIVLKQSDRRRDIKTKTNDKQSIKLLHLNLDLPHCL